MFQARITITLSYWLFFVATIEAADPEIRVIRDNAQRPIAVEATGWTPEELAKFANPDANVVEYLQRALSIYVLDETPKLQRPAMGGTYVVVGDAVRLTPQYALRPGMSYQAEFFPPTRRPVDSPSRKTLDIIIPPLPPAEPTRVTAIYPSASVLPENQLRFYVHFSAPMAAGNAYEHVKLLKADGQIVDRAFLEIGEELWDGTGTRITLLFDPGRVKKGLSPREQFGPVLEAGQKYRLVIEKTWRDANNQSLAADFEKHFTAGPSTESAVDTKQWRIEPPAAGSKKPLIVSFPRPLDRALLMRMITVASPAAKPVTGDVFVSDEERRWHFTPDRPWSAGEHSLVIDTALEDSAGNNWRGPLKSTSSTGSTNKPDQISCD